MLRIFGIFQPNKGKPFYITNRPHEQMRVQFTVYNAIWEIGREFGCGPDNNVANYWYE